MFPPDSNQAISPGMNYDLTGRAMQEIDANLPSESALANPGALAQAKVRNAPSLVHSL